MKGAGAPGAGDDKLGGQRLPGSRHLLFAALEGKVVQVNPAAGGRAATVRVKWVNGQDGEHPPQDLELVRFADPEMGRSDAPQRPGPKLNIRVNGQDLKSFKKQSSSTYKGRDIIKRVKRELAELETALPWHMVDDSWKHRRNHWRGKLKAAEAAPLLSQCLKELLAVLKIQKDMPHVLLRMTQDEFVSALDSIAANRSAQAPADLSHLWDHIKAELNTWMNVKDEKVVIRTQHVHLAHALQAYEACYADEDSYHKVPISRILANTHEKDLLREALLQEHRYLTAKVGALEDPVRPADVFTGVTFTKTGRGGMYGGVPRTGTSMLEGVLHFASDNETDLDVGSEATDLADSDAPATPGVVETGPSAQSQPLAPASTSEAPASSQPSAATAVKAPAVEAPASSQPSAATVVAAPALEAAPASSGDVEMDLS